ncbi:(2Fe-2S)-binding protein [Streptomyces sp. PR69]|uniref:(2Fe-2S)-binding protein n=1 Tax=Streptomyces sp. PR69 TaxID=2984950 RepID=UPI002264A024|nr:(2Fe-2S)-binding protein [Streptomyces sp. PR69]
MNPLPAAPPDSVARALQDVARLGPFFTVGLDAPDNGWHPVEDAYERGLADLIARTAARYDTRELRIGASIVQLGHAARLWSPVLACTVLHGVIPDLTGLHRADDGPQLRLAAPAGWHAEPATPPAQLAGVLYEAVMVRQLERLRTGLRVKVAPGLLYGNAASALAEAGRAILAARPSAEDRLSAVTGELLRTGNLAGTGSVTGSGLGFRRRSCCLYYRTPSGVTCGDCVFSTAPPPRPDA